MIAQAAVVIATFATLGVCVLVQYEALVLTWKWISRHRGHRRVKVLYAIASIITLHVVEIWIFGATIWLLLQWPATGSLSGPEAIDFFECVYLSAATFSTVGFGDIAPVGAIRFLCGTEALSGFVLITWSASFTYLEMERFWRADEMDERNRE
ncbi:MAG TPA: potassium channel family protein [Burkholderiales bacterium]|nr:potassium channel family protein [Burkholderiales bacterium]